MSRWTYGRSATATVYHVEDGGAAARREVMRRTARDPRIALTLGASGTALAASPSAISVSPGSTTGGVAALELVDPVLWSGRSVPAANGIYFGLCDRGPLRPCSLRRGAFAARRQALKLALATLRETSATWSSSACPRRGRDTCCSSSSATSSRSTDIDPLAATADRLFAMGGLVTLGSRGQPRPGQATTVSRRTSGSVKTSRSSRLVDENSETPRRPDRPERVQRVRRDRELLARPEDDLAAVDPQRHEPAAAAERLLLAGHAVERRMPVLGAHLARIEDELLGAVAVGVDVHEHDQALLTEAREPEVGDLDLIALGLGQDDPGTSELLRRILLRLTLLVTGDHDPIVRGPSSQPVLQPGKGVE